MTLVLARDGKTEKIINLIGPYGGRESRILDVGCGFGRNLKALQAAGFPRVTGVDKTPQIVKFVCQDGYECLGSWHFAKSTDQFDVILIQ